ncbi:MAG: DUF4332 domain-containing protein [Desulfuromusa sp.]|nr:DUF4332 domain-containing protein [Desulfuromusa sp.]
MFTDIMLRYDGSDATFTVLLLLFISLLIGFFFRKSLVHESIQEPAFKRDDLKIVEGIGPKIEQLLKTAGINTWDQLAASEMSALKGVLEAAGSRFKMHNPETWPEQARMAAKGLWSELDKYQQYLVGGNIPDFIPDSGEHATPSIVGNLGGLSGYAQDDLKIVEGIGPKIEELLKSAGINTWAELSAASSDQIRQILLAAGSRFKMHNPETWPEQARMADVKEWEKLKEYQDFLDGGKV